MKYDILDIKKYQFLSKTPTEKKFEIMILNKVLNSSEKNAVIIPISDRSYAEKIFNNFYKCTNIDIYKRCYYTGAYSKIKAKASELFHRVVPSELEPM